MKINYFFTLTVDKFHFKNFGNITTLNCFYQVVRKKFH